MGGQTAALPGFPSATQSRVSVRSFLQLLLIRCEKNCRALCGTRRPPTTLAGVRGRLTLGLPGGWVGGRKGGGALWGPYQ